MQMINQIMEILSVDKEMAFRVMDEMWIDFSECSNRQFAKNAREVYAMIQADKK